MNNTIKALEQDLATAKAHPKPSDDSFVGIEIDGKYISEKADAGKAILEFCKQMNNPDPIAIGKYRGFDMELQFSSGVVHCYEIALKGATTQKVSLGEDANGNITRSTMQSDVYLSISKMQKLNLRIYRHSMKLHRLRCRNRLHGKKN